MGHPVYGKTGNIPDRRKIGIKMEQGKLSTKKEGIIAPQRTLTTDRHKISSIIYNSQPFFTK